jgi:PilZ domain
MDREDSMEAAKDLREKRKHPRVIMNLPLEYRVLDTSKPQAGMVINASESGFLIHSIKDMPVGTRINIAVLFLKGFELTNFEVLAEVVWKDIQWEGNRERYQVGLKFVNILEEDHRKLKELLENGHDR